MISVPDRLQQLVEQIEQGQDVDLEKVTRLQALDFALLDRLYVEGSIQTEEDENARAEQQVHDGG